MSIESALSIATQIAEGLKAAHEKGIVHRDIKSSNIMITKNGDVKIMDFGLAKVRGGIQVTKVGSTVGTVANMSPEQARGEKVDQRSDIWSFGAVLYEMLTGKLPFIGDYEQAIVYSILNEEPQSLSELSEEVTEDLVKVVQKTLAKRPDERYQNLGEVIADLKNHSAGTVSTMSTTNKSTLESKTSIAVLPFANMSADLENEYFSEGLSEEIINALTKIKDLKVTARTSSFSFKGKDADIQEIGQKLKVENVLEGSVRQAGDRLRITAQLVKTQDGYHLWSERYDRVMDDVFAIQDEITLAIVDKLKIELMGEEKQAIVVHHTSNLEAYQLYLKGRYYRYTKNNVNGALLYFQQAVALDPSHVLSRVGLAEIYVLQYFYGFTRPHDAYSRARIELDSAFKIQPDSPEVLAVDAFNRLCHDRDWGQIEQQLRRAIGLNPVNVHSHAWYGILLTILGRHDEAKAAMEKAQKLDPLSPYPYAMTGLVFLSNGEVDRAIAAFERALKMEPENMLGQWGFGATLVALGRGDEAVESLERVLDRSGRSMFFLGLFGWALAVAGQTDTAQKILEEFSARSGQEYGTLVGIAWLLAELGEIEKAWDLLWKAEEERQPLTLFLGLPGFDRLRTDNRIGKLKERMHLPS
jgi:TolB-like protein/Tfp pilus assembly protein PilF